MSAPVPHGRLIVLLGDQLGPASPALRDADPRHDRVFMAEVDEETRYAWHHKQKLVFVLSAMRHFAAELRAAGFSVDYVRLDDPDNTGRLHREVLRAADRLRPARIVVCEPGEWRLARRLRRLASRSPVPVQIVPDDRFFCSREAFARWAAGRRRWRMEDFYRHLRQRTGLLMDGEEPAGGRWNFDAENRKALPAGVSAPAPLRIAPDELTREVMALVHTRCPGHFGSLGAFGWAVDRAGALACLEHFVRECLPSFGDYQDAMRIGEPTLFHGLISPYLNVGLLTPREVCERAEQAWRQGLAPLNAVEGFVRQILGWREYVRGIYWLTMPALRRANALGHTRPLPDWYWSGDTDLRCVREVVSQTREHAYAHHIQRLMITGNVALLLVVHPRAVHDWYLAVYIDAFEWVELPNTVGMSQFADGGRLGSKPYVAGGNYVRRMSDYCTQCRYDVRDGSSDDGCPLNALYWRFIDRHAAGLSSNPRMRLIVSGWRKRDSGDRRAVLARANRYLEALDAASARASRSSSGNAESAS